MACGRHVRAGKSGFDSEIWGCRPIEQEFGGRSIPRFVLSEPTPAKFDELRRTRERSAVGGGRGGGTVEAKRENAILAAVEVWRNVIRLLGLRAIIFSVGAVIGAE